MALDQLLHRSQEFDAHLTTLVSVLALHVSPRATAAIAAAALSVEHGRALRVLFAASLPSAACAMLRLQFEALVRGAWIAYAASPTQIEKLSSELDAATEQAAKNLPGLQAMLEDMAKALASQPGIAGSVTPLMQIRAVSWRAMNSFVHTGLHPVRRTSDGFPPQLADQIVRNGNGMTHLAFRLVARLSNADATAVAEVDGSYRDFQGCLPMSA